MRFTLRQAQNKVNVPLEYAVRTQSIRREESGTKHVLSGGSCDNLTYFAPARASLCAVKQEETTDF